MLHIMLEWWVNSYLLHEQVTRILWFKYFSIWSVSLAEDFRIQIVIMNV